MGCQVVWFKRDLRIRDHAPLALAMEAGPVLCLYVYEPELWQSDEHDASHLEFVNESLRELEGDLERLGTRLTLRRGEVVEVLESLRTELAPVGGLENLWAHEETGNRWTYDRDRRVQRWCRRNGVGFSELWQNGVIRPLRDRNGWARTWEQRMGQPIVPVPATIPCGVRSLPDFDHGTTLTPSELGIPESTKQDVQRGGSQLALQTVETFLESRGQRYREEMSSPRTAWESCSRLSTYLAWGNISVREVYQRVRRRQDRLRALPASLRPPGWLSSLQSFGGRLRWHCHFMQKLEDQPEIEFQNMSRAYDGLREDDFDEERFSAWCEGRTGYPLVDACMRALHEHGWINFRMRAMLVSFASYHLWLHWRPTSIFLAQHFLDFEPGIHFSQFQMQSGVTGINTIRIYSPIKQVEDQDPSGDFIRRYVPELSGVPTTHIAEPHKMTPTEQSEAGCLIGRDYPQPIVEHAAAYRMARKKLMAVRGTEAARTESRQVLRRHGSRRRGATHRQQRPRRRN